MDADGRIRERRAEREPYVAGPRGRGPAKYSSNRSVSWDDGDDVEYGWTWAPVKKGGGGGGSSYGASGRDRGRPQQSNPYSGNKGKGKKGKGKGNSNAMDTDDKKSGGKNGKKGSGPTIPGFCNQFMQGKCEKDPCPYLHALRQVCKIHAHKDVVNAVIRVDADMIYTGSKDGTLRTWRAADDGTGRIKVTSELLVDVKEEVCSLLYEPASSWLFCGLGNGHIKCYHKPSLSERVLEGHKNVVWALTFAEGALISGSWDKTIRVWTPDAPSQSFLCVHVLESPGGVRCLLVVGSLLFAGGAKGLVGYDLTTKQRGFYKDADEVGPVMGLITYQNHIVVASLWGECRVFTLDGNKTHVEPPCAPGGQGGRNGGITALLGMVHPVSQAPILVWGMQGGGVATYELPKFDLKGRFFPHSCREGKGDVRALADAGAGMFLSGGGDGFIGLYQWT